jgi:TnpA family transposase
MSRDTIFPNHDPIHAKIIGANDHESHYVFDIMFNNTSDIQPEVHSTDTHGVQSDTRVVDPDGP